MLQGARRSKSADPNARSQGVTDADNSGAAPAAVEESAVPRFYRDAKVLTIGEGTSEILKYVIARQMGLTE